ARARRSAHLDIASWSRRCFDSAVAATVDSGEFETSAGPAVSISRRMAARIIRIPPRAVDFDVRGFAACDPDGRHLLRRPGLRFVNGSNAAIGTPSGFLAARLAEVAGEERGFAFEGAGMALPLLDLLMPVRTCRVATFLATDGAAHIYMIHVGAGWALARLG